MMDYRSLSLDSDFIPTIVPWLAYSELVQGTEKKIPLVLALEAENGRVVRLEIEILPPDQELEWVAGGTTLRVVERLLKFFLWSMGGWKLFVGGSDLLAGTFKKDYSTAGNRAQDVLLMERIYKRQFQVVSAAPDHIPPSTENSFSAGGHFSGYRIGFDIGASDIKVVALEGEKLVFGQEIPWNPKVNTDSRYHYKQILAALKLAEAHIPQVDAIGGSMAGIIVDNELRLASMFRRVSPDDFSSNVVNMFSRIKSLWQKPFRILNDGDVAALAGAHDLGTGALLGIAMGSSQATGYVNTAGNINGSLNELSLTPVNVGKTLDQDDWTGDFGAGMHYFSQVAVNKLALKAGIKFSQEMGLPERLLLVQQEVQQGKERAIEIFKTMGFYLAYTLPLYRLFYPFNNLQLMGRVTSGAGGEIIVHHARKMLKTQFPQMSEQIIFHLPEEKDRRFGQAIAAAGLPVC